MSDASPRVVITGRSMSSLYGTDLEAHYETIRQGTPQFTAHFDPVISDNDYLIVGLCPKPQTKLLPDRKVQKVTTRKDIIGMLAAFGALKDAGIEKGTVDPERIGIYTGTASTHIDDLDAYYELLNNCLTNGAVDTAKFGQNLLGNVNPMVMMQTLMNNVLCYVSIPMDIRGVNANFIDYQISGMRAVGEGFWAIKEGRADHIVAGGISGAPDFYHAQEGIGIGYLADSVSSESADTDVVRPYDQSRCGTVFSEGASFVILESLEAATARGATIYGEILDFTLTSQASFSYMGVDNAQGVSEAFQTQLSRAGLAPKDIGGIYGHGNGALKGDEIDLQGLEAVFKDTDSSVPLTSIKGIIGETNEASGVMSLVDGLRSLKDGRLPRCYNFKNAAAPVAGVQISEQPQELRQGPLIISSKSFSGAHALILLSPYSG